MKRKRKLTKTECAILNIEFPEKKNIMTSIKSFLNPETTKNQIIVNMKLNTGKNATFKISVNNNNSFTFLDGTYIIDEKLSRFNQSFGLNELFYIQNFTLPIDISVDINELKNEIDVYYKKQNQNSLITATNPVNLRSFIVSDVVQSVVQGQALDKFFKKVWVTLVIVALVTIVHLVIYAQNSGLIGGK